MGLHHRNKLRPRFVDRHRQRPAPERVRKFWEFVGREIGVGASRKLGWGRFEVTWK
jgi:hypothetical protein